MQCTQRNDDTANNDNDGYRAYNADESPNWRCRFRANELRPYNGVLHLSQKTSKKNLMNMQSTEARDGNHKMKWKSSVLMANVWLLFAISKAKFFPHQPVTSVTDIRETYRQN